MESHICNHPLVPHTVWYWLTGQRPEDGPAYRSFDNLEDADIFAQKILRQNAERLSWMKIFRADNEAYTCFYWENKKEKAVDNETVKLEVDMEPLKEAFDNVALGFKEQGRSIRLLWGSQVGLAILVFGDILTRVL